MGVHSFRELRVPSLFLRLSGRASVSCRAECASGFLSPPVLYNLPGASPGSDKPPAKVASPGGAACFCVQSTPAASGLGLRSTRSA